MKNRQGSTLVMVLMIFVVLSILATGTMSFMVSENKQSIYQKNKIEAYYIARSGAEAVEAAIMQMSEEEVEALDKKLDKGEVDTEDIYIKGNRVKVTLYMSENKLHVESIGTINGISEEIIKVMERETNSTEKVEINTAIFSNNDITINNGTINGDIGTNNNIIIDGWPSINGNAFFTRDKNITSKNSEWLKQKWSDDRNKKLDSKVVYPLPLFPNYFEDAITGKIQVFPKYEDYPKDLQISPDLEFGGLKDITIDSNKRYKKINMGDAKRLYIDARYKDINIWTEELNNVYEIIVKGTYKVNIHIKSKFSSNSNKIAPITANYSAEINIYFSGNGDNFITNNSNGRIDANLYLNPSGPGINISNSQVYGNIYIYKGKFSTSGGAPNPIIKGNIYSKLGDVELPYGDINGDIYLYEGNFKRASGNTITGDIYIETGELDMGNGKIHGNIISRGNSIIFKGSGKIANGLIYAPNAQIVISGGGGAEGGIICNSFKMSGGGYVTYNSKYMDLESIKLPSNDIGIIFKRSYYK